MTARPLVTIQDPSKKEGFSSVVLPHVLTSPIRLDIVHHVHINIIKNSRQPYAVSPDAGMQSSAESWGTGRAVSRIPRVPGGGTHRAGQGAFGNMCRGGRRFSPTKTYRRWHRKIAKGQRRFATCSALAATAIPALVMSRGHNVSRIAEIPLVIADSQIDGIKKTKEAIKLLQAINAYDDVEKAMASKRLRPGKGKYRNRRWMMNKGPLIIHDKLASESTLIRAFRGIPSVDLCNVNYLNLLTLAPGGHLGRFVVWTESAFKKLNDIFGSLKTDSKVKTGFRIPRAVIANADISRLINSSEIQSVLRPKIRTTRPERKKNPLKNFALMCKLNPFAAVKRRRDIIRSQKAGDKKKKSRKPFKRANSRFLDTILAPAVAPVRGPEEKPPSY